MLLPGGLTDSCSGDVDETCKLMTVMVLRKLFPGIHDNIIYSYTI